VNVVPAVVAIGLGVLMAFVNGANDVSKGIATLAGSGTTSYRGAIAWGTVWTGFGALASACFAVAMADTFGKGLFVQGTATTFTAAIAIICGATAWVLIATRTGLPVSTTHAIVGSLAGVAVVAYGPQAVRWATVVQKIAIPLVAGPLVSLAVMSLLLRTFRRAPAADCACVVVEATPVLAGGSSLSAMTALPQARLLVASSAECDATAPRALSLRLEHLHWLSSGMTSFTRGLNDAPKIAVLILSAWALTGGAAQRPQLVFLAVAIGMVAGSVIGGRRVTKALAEGVTRMDHREGFLSNATTAALVGAGAIFGLPMSTTHVASSAIIAIGLNRRTGQTNRKTVRDMLLAWVVTLPVSALLGVLAFAIGRLCAG
jgi:inorganic phosphate transporter, PiT family